MTLCSTRPTTESGSNPRVRRESKRSAVMERAKTDGAALAYDVAGTGEPVDEDHGAFIADAFRPLLAEPSLVDRYQLILYHRRGYTGSSRAAKPVSISRQAAD